MKTLICIYCEGTDTKIAVVSKEKEKIKLLRTASFDVLTHKHEVDPAFASIQIEGDTLNFNDAEKNEGSLGISNPALINSELKGINLSKCLFIPGLTEPAIYYHIFEVSKKAGIAKVTQEIISDIQETKNVNIDKENLGYIELADRSLLSVFLTGDVNCISLINSLARHNGKRYYKIPSVKSAEISLAYYVAKRKKFFPDDHSLVVYIGKEYSKLIFLHGRKLKHIGGTLDIGTLNLHTYDVYFSKILLEMENGGISSLDNIIVCGEDDSENLILSFYGTFPEANVSRLEFDDIDLSEYSADQREKISSFSVPMAIANDYFDELSEEHKGINLLPKYVKEDQKFFQFAWHGYAMLPLLFAAAFFITMQILINNQDEKALDVDLGKNTILQQQNLEILNKIADVEGKINSFDQTQTILDSANTGTGVWTRIVKEISDFAQGRQTLWFTKLTKEEENKIIIEGYALNKYVLTDFAYTLKGSAILKNILFESLREKNAYKFTITFNKNGYEQGL
ncbi:MAG: PilN domain-containing protein [Ignavibacteriaceae bacterium]|nr:PilN domain-containing protein [Ignavibacteriaceae bacterium]